MNFQLAFSLIIVAVMTIMVVVFCAEGRPEQAKPFAMHVGGYIAGFVMCYCQMVRK